MPSRSPATEVVDEPKSRHQATLVPVPKGAVYGFDFPFEGTAKSPHPGIVIASQVGTRRGVEVVGILALAITHSEQKSYWHDNKAISIPDEEKLGMGLDAEAQWVCLFEQVTAFFPDDVKTIRSAGGSYLGQASDEFTAKVFAAWSDYRTS